MIDAVDRGTPEPPPKPGRFNRRLAEIQQEILWVCEAVHVPVVWATEVLERLTKSGTPTRAQVTDAAMAERAECVMLNKGPYVVPAVTMLDDVLTRMQGHASKKTPQLRALRSFEREQRVVDGQDHTLLRTGHGPGHHVVPLLTRAPRPTVPRSSLG